MKIHSFSGITELCISCYRCVRVCAEQEGDHAINIMNRGFHTQITTEFDGLLKDSACTFCGQCVQTCPTGALGDKKALRHAGSGLQIPPTSQDEALRHAGSGLQISPTEADIEKTRTICPYCGVGCSVDVLTNNEKNCRHPSRHGWPRQSRRALC